MPEIWSQGGFTFVIYFNDHEPAHVHVFFGRPRGGVSLRIVLAGRRVGPDRVPSSWSDANVRRALRIASEHYDLFMKAWTSYH